MKSTTKESAMKMPAKKQQIVEIEGEGLESLLGQRLTLFCANYIYRGILAGVNDTCVLLDEAQVVYETGPFSTREWKDAQPLGGSWYVERGAIESFGLTKSDLVS